jgi:hypothetical protein
VLGDADVAWKKSCVVSEDRRELELTFPQAPSRLVVMKMKITPWHYRDEARVSFVKLQIGRAFVMLLQIY